MKTAFLGFALTVSLAVAAQAATSNSTASTSMAPSITQTPAPVPTTNTTSTSTAEVKPKSSSPWSGSLVIDARADMASASDSTVAESNLNNLTFTTNSYIGAKYKLNPKDSVAVQQYFLYTKLGANSTKEQQGVTIGRQRLVFAKGGYKLGASDEFAIQYRYMLPTAVEYNSKNSLGRFNMPIEVPFTINPKVSLSWLVYPNASFNRSIEKNNIGVSNYGYAYYSATDAVQPYVGLGHSISASNWTSLKKGGQSAELEAGVNFNLPRRIFLSATISQETALEANSQGNVKPFAFLRPSETTYGFIGSFGF